MRTKARALGRLRESRKPMEKGAKSAKAHPRAKSNGRQRGAKWLIAGSRCLPWCLFVVEVSVSAAG
jgi:hypothetical protein